MLHKIGFDFLASLAVFISIFGQIRFLFAAFALDPVHVPIVAAVASAIAGALVGRIFDAIKEAVMTKRRRRKTKSQRLSQ